MRIQILESTRLFDPEPMRLIRGDIMEMPDQLAKQLIADGVAAAAPDEQGDEDRQSNHPAIEQATARPGEFR